MMGQAEQLLMDEDDPANLKEDLETLFANAHEGESFDSPVDWSYLDAIERREIDVSKFPKWARNLLNDIDDPEQRKYTEEMLTEQFSNKSLYDDAYFEEAEGENREADDSEDDEG